jgi:hypothetical protein
MHQQLRTSISNLILPALAVGALFSGTHTGSLNAQDQQPERKKVTEPVFRVSKLSEARPAQSTQDQPRALPTPIAKPQPQRNLDRIADSSTMPRANSRSLNTDLPSTTITPTRNIPTPNIPIPTVTTPKMTPADLPSATTRPPVTAVKARVPHPLDRAVETAKVALTDMRNQVRDYTAIFSKRERINGVLADPSYMNIKVRCPRTEANGAVTPFSIYMKFLRPTEMAGREVLWVDGQNSGKLSVHEAKGLLKFKTFQLDPTGTLAMRGQRYPIYEAGLENLIIKLIEKADRDRAAGPCVVDYRPGSVNKRPCSLIELIHDERQAPYEFHKAQVYIDDELQLPIRFAAYDWPTSPGATPQLLEEYTYYNVKVNVGLTDNDFSTKNPQYKFPNR